MTFRLPKDGRHGATGKLSSRNAELWNRTDLSRQESVQEFLAQLEKVGEGVLAKYGHWEGQDTIDELRMMAEQQAWLSHAARLEIAKSVEPTSTQPTPNSVILPPETRDRPPAPEEDTQIPTGIGSACVRNLLEGGRPAWEHLGFAAEVNRIRGEFGKKLALTSSRKTTWECAGAAAVIRAPITTRPPTRGRRRSRSIQSSGK